MESGWKPRPWAVPLESLYYRKTSVTPETDLCAPASHRLQFLFFLKSSQKRSKTDGAAAPALTPQRTHSSGGKGRFFWAER